MVDGFLERIFALMGISSRLVNATVVLSAALLFFLAVNCLIVFFNKKLSPHKVKGTILVALLGFIVLLLDRQVSLPPPNQDVLKIAFNLIVMLCAANLLTYLVVDIFFFHRMDRQVPDYKRDLTSTLMYVVFGMAALRFIFRLDIASILTTTTVLTAAVAFAMQNDPVQHHLQLLRAERPEPGAQHLGLPAGKRRPRGDRQRELPVHHDPDGRQPEGAGAEQPPQPEHRPRPREPGGGLRDGPRCTPRWG